MPLNRKINFPPINWRKMILASEVVIHGEPSGLDNTTSCFGGAVRLNRSLGRFETLPTLPELNILITNTKVPRNTNEQVAKVRQFHESMPTNSTAYFR